MATTEKQLIDELKAGNFKPVYLLTGEENYYIDVMGATRRWLSSSAMPNATP